MSDHSLPAMHYLKDYKPSEFLVDTVFLHFELEEQRTSVKTILTLRRNRDFYPDSSSPLILDGEKMQLQSVQVNGRTLNSGEYHVDEQHLKIENVPDEFILETEVLIKPQENTQLSGLYKSGGNFCTQCESRGFRRITYFLDRPDILAKYTTTISAHRRVYPILLANGNLTDSRELSNDRHWVKWEDPTRKPSYLFALVAGNLDALEDKFITCTDREIKLAVYVEPGKTNQARYAMHALKDAMRWDEKVYGREYDLDMYMIVAVSDFNFGAMENKGLNIFNDKYILVDPETATDDDYLAVQAVVAHEYFHNWSGNRVTVRDWFQITLKEGLTVFREHQFSADMNSPVVKRIQDAKDLRNRQFIQDAGPMAHPIYPDSYIEINNFYTVTVYEKGAEVIRMMYTMLGPELFRKAMDIYFGRNDGFPATVEEFVKAMEEGSGLDLRQFRRWYKQSGTPVLSISDDYDAETKTYALTASQFCPPTPGQSHKEPFHIPLVMGLLGKNGEELMLQESPDTDKAAIGRELSPYSKLLHITQPSQTFYFNNVPVKPVPSLLRHFSAPVKLEYAYSNQELTFLMRHDSDLFNRWDAGQQLAQRILLDLIKQQQQEEKLIVPEDFIDALRHLFKDPDLDRSLLVEMLTLPSEAYLIDQMSVADVDAVHTVREWLKKHIALALKEEFLGFYQQHSGSGPYHLDAAAIAERRMKNLSLNYLMLLEKKDYYDYALEQFKQANNMTDTMGAMMAINNIQCQQRKQMIAEFYLRWSKLHLVVDKWFSLQAVSSLPNTLEVVKSLCGHEAFDIKNPNRVRALIGAFAMANPYRFHAEDGAGYLFLADNVLKIDPFNPQLAARMVESLSQWRKFDLNRQMLMRTQLERIAAAPKISKDVYEVVSKSLA